MTDRFQRALDEVRAHLRTKQDHPANRTYDQRKMDRWKARLNADPQAAMRETERMLWAIHDQGRPLDTSDPSGVGGFQLYTWASYMRAAKRTHEPLHQWVMAELDRGFEAKGLLRTSAGWLPIGAVTPGNQNPIEPIDEIVDIEGQATFVMAYKAVILPGGGWRLAKPGEMLDGEHTGTGQVAAAGGGVDAGGDGADGGVRPDDADGGGDGEQRPLWPDAPDDEPDDLGGRVLRAARRRIDEDGGGGGDHD